MKTLIRRIFIVSIAVLTGAFFIWLVQPSSVWPIGVKDALCTLELQADEANISVSFTTNDALEQFFIFARPEKKGERLSLTITGEEDFLCSISAISEPMRFSFSPDEIPPGTYTAVLNQETGNLGGQVIITDKQVGLRGWHILSRVFLVLLVVSGGWTIVARKSRNQRQRIVIIFIFHSLLLSFILMFLYLLFHEGGHALAASLFGVFDWNRSDFWGIHGMPHSGIKRGALIEPWQLAFISFAGPMLPTLIGWGLFLFWRSRTGKRIRSMHKIFNIYLTAVVFMSVFPFVAVLGHLTGITSDGDWRGFIENVPCQSWLAKTLVVVALLFNVFILYRIVPELWRVLKSEKVYIKNILRQSTD